MTFKVGDLVRVNNPTCESTNWLLWADRMDKLNGVVAEVIEIKKDGSNPPMYVLDDCENWVFAGEWLEPADQLSGQMSIEDFGLVVN